MSDTSNLSKMFGSQPKGKKSLTYQATPKKSGAKKSSAVSQLLLAETGCVAYLFNKSEKKYDSKGKTGGAVLGNIATRSFDLLLYKKANQQLCKVSITSSFKFTIQNKFYGSFTDDDGQIWSLKLGSEESATRFAMQISIAKAFTDNLEAVVVQNLEEGDGQAIENEDEVKIKYTGHLVTTDGKIGNVFDSNVADGKATNFQFIVGAGKVVKGMDDGVLGMKKKGKRIIIIPPQFGYGSKPIGDKIPAGATLAFEIEVDRVKYKNAPEKEKELPKPEPIEEESETKREEVLKRAEKIGESMDEAPQTPQTPQTPQMPYGYPPYGMPPPNPYGMPQGYPPMYGNPGGYPGQYGYGANPYQPAYGAPPPGMNYQGQQMVPVPQQPIGNQVAVVPQQSESSLLQKQLEEQQLELQKQIAEQKEALEEAKRAFAEKESIQEAIVETEAPISHAKSAEDLMVSVESNKRFIHQTMRMKEDIKTTVQAAASKVEQLHTSIKKSIFGQSQEQGGAQGLLIVQTIQKYIEDNEQLQHEVNMKAERIDELREKLTGLLDKNKELIEQQTRVMEERNDSLSTTSDKRRTQTNKLREEKLELEEELNQTQDLCSKQTRSLSHATSKNEELLMEMDSLTSELDSLRSSLLEVKGNRTEDSTRLQQLRSDVKEELARKKTIRTRTEDIEGELQQIGKELKKNKALFDARKAKWLEVKEKIKVSYEEEKMETVRKVKLQLMKFKEEKENAIEDADHREAQTEEKWRGNVERVKDQFNDRVEQLKSDLAEDYATQIDQAVERVTMRAEKMTSREALAKVKAFDAGKLRAFEIEAKPLDVASLASVQLSKKVEALDSSAQAFMMAHIKQTMNQFYFAMKESVDPDASYSGADLLENVMATLRDSTFDSLQRLDDFSVEDDVDESGERAITATDMLDLGLNENQLLFDVDSICADFQLTEDFILSVPQKQDDIVPESEPEVAVNVPEDVVEEAEEEEQEEVVENQRGESIDLIAAEEEEGEKAIDEVSEEVEDPMSAKELSEDLMEEEEEIVEEQEEEIEEQEEQAEEQEEEAEEQEEEEEEEIEVEDPLSTAVGEEEQEEEEEEEEGVEEVGPLVEEYSKKETLSVGSSIFGDDSGDLFGAPSPKTEKKSVDLSFGDDSLTSKLSNKKVNVSDLFGDSGDDLFSSAPKKTSKTSNLDNIFASSPSSSGSTTTKDLFSF